MAIDTILYEPFNAEAAADALKRCNLPVAHLYQEIRINQMLAWNVHNAMFFNIRRAKPTMSKRLCHEEAALLISKMYDIDMAKNMIYANVITQLTIEDNNRAGGS